MPRKKNLRTGRKTEKEEEVMNESPTSTSTSPTYTSIIHHHDSENVVWGLLFIFLGITFLLNTFNLVPWIMWSYLWRYWPVLLILAGLQMLLGRHPGSSFVMLVVVFLIFLSIWTIALVDIHSPLVYSWHLNQLPWFNFLTQFRIK